MILKSLNMCCNFMKVYLPLVTIFNFNYNHQCSSPDSQSKSRRFAQHTRARFKPNPEQFGSFRRVN